MLPRKPLRRLEQKKHPGGMPPAYLVQRLSHDRNYRNFCDFCRRVYVEMSEGRQPGLTETCSAKISCLRNPEKSFRPGSRNQWVASGLVKGFSESHPKVILLQCGSNIWNGRIVTICATQNSLGSETIKGRRAFARNMLARPEGQYPVKCRSPHIRRANRHHWNVVKRKSTWPRY